MTIHVPGWVAVVLLVLFDIGVVLEAWRTVLTLKLRRMERAQPTPVKEGEND